MRRFITGLPRRAILCAVPLLVLGTSPALAEPERGRPETGSESESERHQAPARADVQDDELRQIGPVQLEPRTVPATAEHRPEVLTDAGIGQAARLTDHELVKLEMARAAVEASRAAGTLHVTAIPEDLEPATPEEIEAIKLQQLEGVTPQIVESDPVAGIGEIPPIQEIGPPGLTEYEQRKLNGENPEPAQAEEVAAPPVDHADGDGAPAPVREVQSDE